ncbi:hypothetical protein OAG1_30480 [Agarivorans sp. OAG1]|uniref:protein DpdG n=1 Tax=Agarivorans sp. OAG1 TaxID=3082387 RepID=UPI002B2ED11C|nr:hypothetical protein OAG1_30480 [Agarivorans sp. OAG1]
MSIVNNDHGGSQFEVLAAIYSVLKGNKENPMEQEELIAWCRPQALIPEGKKSARSKLDKEVKAWSELGLLETADTSIKLSSNYFTDSKVRLTTGARRCLLASENNKDLISRDQRAADFTVLLSMLLALDVYRYPEIKSNNLAEIVDRYLSDFRINSNETSVVPGYAHWLGFMVRTGNSVYSIDPTLAIREEIAASTSVFKPDTQIPIDTFIGQLAKLMPVLDGGAYRQQVEQRIEGQSWTKPKDNELSTSLSRALLRLHHGGQIQLQKLSDAGLRNLKGPKGEILMPVTHVTVRGE